MARARTHAAPTAGDHAATTAQPAIQAARASVATFEPCRRLEPRHFLLDGREHVLCEAPALEAPAHHGLDRSTVAGARLTAAERAVTRALVTGRSNAEIAALRGVSVRTVANQLASIYEKLGVGSRLELVALVTSGARTTRIT
jgi:DNA-binding CsgD family transcriptional regulator